MRKVIQWDTPFTNRENTNAKIYQEVNNKSKDTTANINTTRKQQTKTTQKVEKIITLAEFYKIMKLKRIEKTINSTGDIHTITFDVQLRPRIPPGRRPGRPKFKWAEKGITEYWDRREIASLGYLTTLALILV